MIFQSPQGSSSPRSTLRNPDPRERLAQQQDAYYNLGNTLYREGQRTEKSDAAKTIESWSGAVKAYDAALQLRADDADSKFNRELVNRKLEQLKKQQQSQSKQGQSQSQSGSKDQQGASGNSSASQQPKNGSQTDQSAQSEQNRNSKSGKPSGADQGQPQQAQQQASRKARRGISAAAGNNAQTAQNRDAPANGQEHRVPGEMSPEEARELLDSVKDEERRAPTAASAGNSEASAHPEEIQKDW